MGPEDLGAACLKLENDTELTREERERKQAALLFDYLCHHLGPMSAGSELTNEDK
jgi:hypothetical protein